MYQSQLGYHSDHNSLSKHYTLATFLGVIGVLKTATCTCIAHDPHTQFTQRYMYLHVHATQEGGPCTCI